MRVPRIKVWGHLHPFLFGAFFVLGWFHYLQNMADPGQAAIFLASFLVAVWGLLRLLSLWIRDRTKRCLIASFLVLFFCFYGDLQAGVERVSGSWFPLIRFRYFFPVTSLAIFLAAAWVWKTRKDLARLNLAIEIMAGLLVASTLLQIAFHKKVLLPDLEETGTMPRLVADAGFHQERPDIYFILLDSHTGAESLKKYWNYDNTPFIKQLQKRGFFCVPDARSHYAATSQVIATRLDMCRPGMPEGLSWPEQFIWLRELIRHSELVRNFTDLGYEIRNLSLFDLGDRPKFYSLPALTESASLNSLMRNTAFGYVWQYLFTVTKMKTVNLKIFSLLQQMPKTAPKGKPLFVYAHLMMPHWPYLFDRNGKSIAGSPSMKNKEAYLEQLIYADKLTLRAIDAILSQSRTPPIILLQGDHGFRFLDGPARSLEANSILDAYFLPDHAKKGLPERLMPTDCFRWIFNHYFGAHYELEAKN